jgi:hypothetical protein
LSNQRKEGKEGRTSVSLAWIGAIFVGGSSAGNATVKVARRGRYLKRSIVELVE